MTYASQLWRFHATDRSLTTEAQAVRLALATDPNLLQVTVTPDGDTGALWVAFFAESNGVMTGARVGQRAMLALAARPEFAGAEAKPEWGGAVYPDPDPARPESFPPVATIEWVKAMRHSRIFGGSNPNARWYKVSAQVHGIDRALVVKTAAAMDAQIKQMRRVDQPRVGISKDGSVVELRFLIGGLGPQDAAREGFHLADALVTMTVADEKQCRIEVQEVSEVAPRAT